MKLMSIETGGKGGVIANITSIAGISIIPVMPIYTATKHAVTAFTRSLAVSIDDLISFFKVWL